MTIWTLEFKEGAFKKLQKLDKPIQKQIFDYLQNLDEFWSYRIGDYRAICSLEDEIYTVLAIRIAHRREVYD